MHLLVLLLTSDYHAHPIAANSPQVCQFCSCPVCPYNANVLRQLLAQVAAQELTPDWLVTRGLHSKAAMTKKPGLTCHASNITTTLSPMSLLLAPQRAMFCVTSNY
jgi:hypothetical protein